MRSGALGESAFAIRTTTALSARISHAPNHRTPQKCRRAHAVPCPRMSCPLSGDASSNGCAHAGAFSHVTLFTVTLARRAILAQHEAASRMARWRDATRGAFAVVAPTGLLVCCAGYGFAAWLTNYTFMGVFLPPLPIPRLPEFGTPPRK